MRTFEYKHQNDGFNGILHLGEKYPNTVILRFGGTGATMEVTEESAQFLIDAGYTVLIIGVTLWKKSPNAQIPVEYVSTAIERIKEDFALAKFSDEPIENITFCASGISFGATYALLCASYISEISCVIAASPIDYIYEAIANITPLNISTFTYNGEDLPFTEFKTMNKGAEKVLFKCLFKKGYGLRRIIRYLYDTNPPEESSAIKVENMNARVLLMASKNDDCWFADESVVRIADKLAENGYKHEVKVHIFEEGSHVIGGNVDLNSKRGKKLKKKVYAIAKNKEAAQKSIDESMIMTLEFLSKC